jgi:hypothetical protein
VAMHMSESSTPLTISETLDFSHYGAPFSLTAPPANEVITLQQLLHTADCGQST